MLAGRPFFSIRPSPCATLAVTIACTVAGCGAPASTADNEPPEVISFRDQGLLANGLTRTEAETVLKLIDDICGDTWCEGDNDFRFRYLFCDRNTETCSLALQMGARETPPTRPQWHWHLCRTTRFLGFESLVTTSSGGYQWLTSTYYEALNACIDGLEKSSAEPRDPSR